MRSSPFVGVFAKATNRFVLLPMQLQKKELHGLNDFFGVEIIHANIANSSLIGALTIANKHGILLPGIAEERELKQLEQLGLRAKKVGETNALGNLVALNDTKAVCGKTLAKETQKEIKNFLKVEVKQMAIASSDLAGAAIVTTNKGFVATTKATKKELEALEAWFGLKGKTTTANYGDAFIANSIIANDRAALVGLHSTQHELLRIDEGLSGE